MGQWIQALVAAEASERSLFGAKHEGLCALLRLGLPVPPGFTIGTNACRSYLDHQAFPDGFEDELSAAVADLEANTGRRLGDAAHPLIVSVRSSPVVSMPGMLDTVLNVGLTRDVATELAKSHPRMSWDSYRRFVCTFGEVVLELHPSRFRSLQGKVAASSDLASLEPAILEAWAAEAEALVAEFSDGLPQDPLTQLRLAVKAVFRSFASHRARYYRKSHGLDDSAGTAVTIQRMVFGNHVAPSGSGVLFSRNPKSGEPGLFGEWLARSQGDDVVSGTRTPASLSGVGEEALQQRMPEVYAQLAGAAEQAEAHFGDLQEIEFTVEQGTPWLLQTRPAPRTAIAAIQVAVDFVAEGRLSPEAAVLRVGPEQIENVLRPLISPEVRRKVIARGLDASPGAACGQVVFDSSECQAKYDEGIPTILVRSDTSSSDIQGMTVANGVVTSRGGQTSHAAVVARSMGKPCVVGCSEIHVDYARGLFYVGDSVVRRGEWITVDGSTGEIMEGQVELLPPQVDAPAVSTLLEWADTFARLQVRANADTAPDAQRAQSLGAGGVGLCRTEQLFFQPDALAAMRRLILSDSPQAQQRALHDILPLQRSMFRALFQQVGCHPVAIRLLDPPLHDFLPTREEDVSAVAADLGVRNEALQGRIDLLRESNPALGHRGVRVGITSPDIYRMQVRAIFEAACELFRDGTEVRPEIVVPLVAMEGELAHMRTLVQAEAERVIGEFGGGPPYEIGTMIEVPRAALLAGALAGHADFFSFGTNDLTQMTYALSRDDMGRFLADYQREGLVTASPLTSFDVRGVGQLVELAIREGRASNPRLRFGVSGEHGSDPQSVAFFHDAGVDYVSCSPVRVPIARLAAAHAALNGAQSSP